MIRPLDNPDNAAAPSHFTDGPTSTNPDPAQRKLSANRPQVWLGGAGVLVILALLLSFQHVVKGAVTRSVERQKASALHATAKRECKALPSLVAIDRCTGLLATPSTDATVQTAFFSF